MQSPHWPASAGVGLCLNRQHPEALKQKSTYRSGLAAGSAGFVIADVMSPADLSAETLFIVHICLHRGGKDEDGSREENRELHDGCLDVDVVDVKLGRDLMESVRSGKKTIEVQKG